MVCGLCSSMKPDKKRYWTDGSYLSCLENPFYGTGIHHREPYSCSSSIPPPLHGGCPQGPASVGRVCDSRPHTRCPNLTKVRRNKSWGRIDFGRYFFCTSDNLTARIMCAWSSTYFKTYLDLSLLKRSRHRPARPRETLPDILCSRHPCARIAEKSGHAR